MNLSESFQILLNQPGPILSDAEIRDIRAHYRILLLKGFLGDLLPKSFDSYFYDQMRWMREHDIQFTRLARESGYYTQKLSQNNVEAIAHEIRASRFEGLGKKVIIVSHSKGGIDTLETLLQTGARLDNQVAGWIALQAPFGGTPVADWATRNRPFNYFAESMLGGPFKGDRKVAASMTLDARKEYMARHASAILDLVENLDVLAFATSSAAKDPSVFRPLRFAIEKFAKLRNDGLLPIESQVLRIDGIPLCPYIEVEHIDHVSLVLPLNFGRRKPENRAFENNRTRIFNAILKLWMDRRENRRDSTELSAHEA